MPTNQPSETFICAFTQIGEMIARVRSLVDLAATALRGLWPDNLMNLEHLQVRVRAFRPLDAGQTAQEAFQQACEQGDLLRMQWLWSQGGVNVHAAHEQAFRMACYHGYEDVARWLHSLSGVHVHELDEWAFRYACSNGHENVARWLHSLGGVNVHARNDDAFEWACLRGDLKVAQWLHSLGGVNVNASEHNLFEWACREGWTSLAQWLYSLGGFILRMQVFRTVCERGYLATAQWMYSLNILPPLADEYFRGQCEQALKMVQMLQWLHSHAGMPDVLYHDTVLNLQQHLQHDPSVEEEKQMSSANVAH